MTDIAQDQLQQLFLGVFNLGSTPPLADSRYRSEQLRRIVEHTITTGWSHSQAEQVLQEWFRHHSKDVDLVPSLYRETFKRVTGSYPPTVAPALKLKTFADVEAKAVTWLFSDLIPHKEVTLLVGLNDIGKSTLVVHWMAELTQGRSDGIFEGVPVKVLWIVEEENKETFTRPRLDLAGADVTRVFCIEKEQGKPSRITIPDDLEVLRATIIENGIRVVVFDPLTQFFSDGLSENSNHDVRAAVTPLMEMCQELDVSVVGIAHMRKDGARKGHSMLGSTGLEDAVRCSLWAHYDRADNVRYVGVKKGNASADKNSRIFTLTEGFSTSSGIPVKTACADIVGSDERWIVDIMNTTDYRDPSLDNMPSVESKILELVPPGTRKLRSEVMEELDEEMSIRTFERALTRLADKGYIRMERTADDYKRKEIVRLGV